MLIIIPTQLITSLTFPGVILHEIAHQFMCDLCNVPIYSVDYYLFESDDALGRVTHKPTDSYYKELCIGLAPLLINSIVCMALTIPIGTAYTLGTLFLDTNTSPLQFFTLWIGFSCGFHAIPSKQDVAGLYELATTPLQKGSARIIQAIIHLCNFPNISFAFSLAYACMLSLIIPMLFLK